MTSTEPQPVIPSEARDLLFLRANAIFLSSPNKSLRQIPHSRYNREADNYAKAPLRRLFHFQARFDPGQTPSDESRPIQKSLIMNDLRTLKMSLPANHSFSSACALFQKQGGYTPKPPILERHPLARAFSRPPAFAAVLGKPLPRSPLQAAVGAERQPEMLNRRPLAVARFSLARKKRFPSHWARFTETQPLLTPFTQVFRYTAPIFGRLIDEARAISR